MKLCRNCRWMTWAIAALAGTWTSAIRAEISHELPQRIDFSGSFQQSAKLHAGGPYADAETRIAMGMRALENLRLFFQGQPLRDKVV